jgi:predicted  nucleic acid-binding Zn ribbon protein
MQWKFMSFKLDEFESNFKGLASCIMNWEERILACNQLSIRGTAITKSSSREQIMKQ